MRNNDLWGTKVTKTFAYTLLYMIIFVFLRNWRFDGDGAANVAVSMDTL